VLMGQAPGAIPIVDTANNDPIVDWRQLRRWSLDERRLPAESRILNRELSLWDRHRQAILLAAGVIALQAIWIVALMLNRRRLRRTQHSFAQEVEHRLQAEGDSRRLRARLSAAEKQTTLGALAGGIAHEINQPLIAIKNYAQAAKRYLATDPPQGGKLAELVAEMEGEVDRAGAIIRKVRKLLASGRVDAEPVELDPVLREVLAVMKQECEGHACRIDYPLAQPVPKVLADALQVQLVMVNLLRNAIEAIEAGGPSGERTISVGVTAVADGKVQVSVADCGPGICADDAEEIFEPLFTTKSSGMGIGLATCRTIIEAHGGRIGCEPNPAGGTVFRFTLPIA
jgi:C4-dicarboxylate-specific signal transduction histidine kinase